MTFFFVYPQFKKLTGAERLILKLAEYVTRLGHKVNIVTHRFAESCRPQLAEDVGLIETGRTITFFKSHYLDAPFEYLFSPTLLDYIKDAADAICFFGPPSLPALWYAKAIRRVNIPCLYFCYEPPRFIYSDRAEIVSRMGMAGPIASPFFSIYKLIDQRMVRQADGVLVNGSFGQKLVEEAYGLTSHIITHGVDIARDISLGALDLLRAKYHLKETNKVILTINHLHPRKRIDLLIRAMPYILREVHHAVALIVGDGPEKRRLVQLSEELELEKDVVFCGFVEEAELPAHYALCDVYAHLAKRESFGLSVIEAAACGKPVVSVDEGGPRETVVDGETGFLVEAEPQRIANRITHLLRDDSEAKRMGTKGQKHVIQHYRWEWGGKTFVQVCRQLRSRPPC